MLKKFLKLIHPKGFTLLEVVFSIGIITVGMTGVSSLVIMNIQAENINKNYLVASMLAQEGLELVRNKRDTNWLISGSDWKMGKVGVPNSNILNDGSYTIDRTGVIDPAIDSIDDFDARLYIKNTSGVDYYQHDDTGAITPYYRMITVNDHNTWIEVIAAVKWNNRGKIFNYVATTYLYDWR